MSITLYVCRRPFVASPSGPEYDPSRDATDWLRFCLQAHVEQALAGYLNRSGFVAEAEVSTPTGNLDIRRLLDAGLIVQQGRGRVSRYVASEDLRQALGQPSAAG